MAAVISIEKCTGCGRCIEACPVDAIALDETKKAVIIENLCIGCGACVDKCKKEAISLTSTNPVKEKRINESARNSAVYGGGSGTGKRGKSQRGGGRGSRAGSSIAGDCLCLQCMTVIPHAAGMPCNKIKCPKCGASMVRK